MKTTLLPIFVAIGLAGAAQAEPRALTGFSRVSASAGTQVEVEIGPSFSVDVSGRDAARITTRVENGTLIIAPVRTWGWSIRGPRDALVRVAMPRADGLNASSGAHIAARGLDGGAVALDASSGARIEVAGACSSISAEASSGSRIRAAELRCENGAVDVSSGAQVHVFASGRLDIDASSGGGIVASGNPAIGEIDLSSGGSFRREEG